MDSFEIEREKLRSSIARIDAYNFDDIALQVFRIQAENCKVYADYIKSLNLDFNDVENVDDIPYLPISAFKHHSVKTGVWEAVKVFTSSSTSGTYPSRHLVRDIQWYNTNASLCFKSFYGDIRDYSFFCLLPSYLEREGSSLVHMANHFINESSNKGGFYLYDHSKLIDDIRATFGKKILLGVSYALLDLASIYSIDKPHDVIIMETGGMKGRRSEMNRSELHAKLISSFGVNSIHSEYGMTELLSQAYSQGEGIFKPAVTMKVSVAQINDPLSSEDFQCSGLLKIIDLANIDSCSFVLTDDLGIVFPNGSFQVIGRADHSEIRGCNLMVSDL